MNSYNIDDEVTYVSKNNDTNRGSIVRFLRNGNVIIKNKNEQEEKINNKNIVSNMDENLKKYIDNLEDEIGNSLYNNHVLENHIDDLLYKNNILFVFVVALAMYIIGSITTIIYYNHMI